MTQMHSKDDIFFLVNYIHLRFIHYIFFLQLKKNHNQGTIVTLLLGLGLFAWGLVTIVIPIYDFVLVERLKMEPGYPPFEQWVIII